MHPEFCAAKSKRATTSITILKLKGVPMVGGVVQWHGSVVFVWHGPVVCMVVLDPGCGPPPWPPLSVLLPTLQPRLHSPVCASPQLASHPPGLDLRRLLNSQVACCEQPHAVPSHTSPPRYIHLLARVFPASVPHTRSHPSRILQVLRSCKLCTSLRSPVAPSSLATLGPWICCLDFVLVSQSL